MQIECEDNFLYELTGPEDNLCNRWMATVQPCNGRATREDCCEVAALLAAAPEMLATLEAILLQTSQGRVYDRDACITQARAAIAKARGEKL